MSALHIIALDFITLSFLVFEPRYFPPKSKYSVLMLNGQIQRLYLIQDINYENLTGYFSFFSEFKKYNIDRFKLISYVQNLAN